jgi:hypothetical protein
MVDGEFCSREESAVCMIQTQLEVDLQTGAIGLEQQLLF